MYVCMYVCMHVCMHAVAGAPGTDIGRHVENGKQK